MTLQQVEALIGPGTLSTQSNIDGFDDTLYMWYAPGDQGDATVEFQNNSLIVKSQFGLSG
jgi:hypothetical protein